MTMTDDFFPTAGPWRAQHEAEASAWEEREHRRHLRLIAAAGLALGLAIAGGLGAAWQIDRVLTDWHYGLGQPVMIEPDGLEHPSVYAPGVRA